MIKVISFDLDDTLSDSNFDELIWRAEIPKAYAKEKGVSFEEAYKAVTSEYNALWGKSQGNWRDASFWLAHFGLKTTWEELVEIVPIENLLTETDCPYLSPYPGKKNEPSFIIETIKSISKIKKLDPIEVENLIFMNFQKVFLKR